MLDYFITFRSVTRAQRGEELLDQLGVNHQMLRAPKSIATQGCGYALAVSKQSLQRAVRGFKQNEIAYQRVYYQNDRGQMEVIPDDLFG